LLMLFVFVLQVTPSEAQLAWAGMAAQQAPDRMHPNWLLLNAVHCEDPPHNARLVELLLQRGVALEEVDEGGDTALVTAVRLGNVEVRGVGVVLGLCF
jgi:hypothetical protein